MQTIENTTQKSCTFLHKNSFSSKIGRFYARKVKKNLILKRHFLHNNYMRILGKHPQIKINQKFTKTGFTPLHHAVMNGHIDSVEHLLAVPGIDVNCTATSSKTALSNRLFHHTGPRHKMCRGPFTCHQCCNKLAPITAPGIPTHIGAYQQTQIKQTGQCSVGAALP